MDPTPPPDPTPASALATGDAVPPFGNSTASALSPSQPSYAEMITAALTSLNESNGSSKQAIGKYIEAHYGGLPPTHAALLSDHLKMLRYSGELVMVKHSYKLAARAAAAPANAGVSNAVNPSDYSAKRRRGRPPKAKVDNNVEVQRAVPVFAPPANAINVNSSPQNAGPVGPNDASTAAGLEPAGTANGLKRGRGRPPKTGGGGADRGSGRPPKRGGAGSGRPLGRPPKQANMAGASPETLAIAPVLRLKRRGRPPKNAAGGGDVGVGNLQSPKKQRRLSGKPLGRPRKNAPAAATVNGGIGTGQDSQLLVAYLDLKAKFETLQSRIRQTATLIRPCLNDEAALSALQELEIAGTKNPIAPPSAQAQPQPPLVPPPQG